MLKQFFVPVITMLAGLALWVLTLVLYKIGGWTTNSLPLWESFLGLASGGLVVVSGIHCRQLSGPRAGNIIRTSFLLIMAIFSYGNIGTVMTGLLVFSAVITSILAIMGPKNSLAESDLSNGA